MPSTTCGTTGTSTIIKLVTFHARVCHKTDDEAEAHFLRTKYWMDSHVFPCSKVWYESSRPLAVGCNGLQAQFSQYYSKTGSTREQLYHA